MIDGEGVPVLLALGEPVCDGLPVPVTLEDGVAVTLGVGDALATALVEGDGESGAGEVLDDGVEERAPEALASAAEEATLDDGTRDSRAKEVLLALGDGVPRGVVPTPS